MMRSSIRWAATAAMVVTMVVVESGCGRQPGGLSPHADGVVDGIEVIDLVDRAFSAAVVREVAAIDIGSPSSARAQIAGWGSPEIHEPTGASFAWVVDKTATLEFFLFDPRFDSLELRCRGFSWSGGPDQKMTVVVNGRKVDRIELPNEFGDITIGLPAGVLGVGSNRVELAFAWTARPSDHLPGSTDGRTLAAAFQRIALGPTPAGGGEALSKETPRAEGGGLVLPAETGLSFRFPAPERAVLDLAVASARASTDVEARVWIARPGEPAIDVVAVPPTAVGDRTLLDLDWPAGEPVELVLAAVGGTGSRVTMSEPRVLGIPVRVATPANLLVIVVDTLRADAVGVYGSPNHTPTMDALAAGGVRFSQARSHIPITGPSHASLFTSLLPMEHGVLNNAQELGVGFPTLAEALRASGRSTAAVISLGVLQRQFGFDRGFDHYGDGFPRDWLKDAAEVTDEALDVARRFVGGPSFLFVHYSDPHEPYAPSDAFYPRFELRLDGDPIGRIDAGGRGFRFEIELPTGGSVLEFVPVDESEPGRVYRVDNLLVDDASITVEAVEGWHVIPRRMGRTTYESEFPATVRLTNPGEVSVTTGILVSCKKLLAKREIRAAYAGETEFVDREIGRLLAGLSELGMMADTLVVFTSDHGEGLGNHNHVGHISQLYDSLLHVPLILTWPGRLPEGVTIDDPVSLVDLFPTLAELLGLDGPTSPSGVSLTPLIRGMEAPERATLAATYRPESYSDKRAIVLDGFKYIFSWRDGEEKEELYDVVNDPGELENLARTRPEVLDRLRTELGRRLSEIAERAPVEAELSDEDRAHLRALGYLH